MDKFSKACTMFGLTISIQKTYTLVQGTDMLPDIKLNDQTLEVVSEFQYLGSTITDDLSLSKEISKRIGKAQTTFSKLSNRVWNNTKLTTNTKMAVYRACIISTLLYGSESWTTSQP